MHKKKIFLNSDVITMDQDRPRVEAFGVLGDRFAVVGDREAVMAWGGSDASIEDLGGRTVLPGFLETHNHLSWFAVRSDQVDLATCRNIGEIKTALKVKAASIQPGEWMGGYGFDSTLIEDNRHLHRNDLDEVSIESPVVVTHVSGHLMYANSKALALAGIGRDTTNPSGGEIGRDGDGEPNGLLTETACYLLMGILPEFTAEQIGDFIIKAVDHAHRFGVTSIHDAAIGMWPGGVKVVEAYRRLFEEGNLRLRVYMTILEPFFSQLSKLGLGTGFGGEYVKIGCVKLVQDGSIQGWTAALTEPYFNRPDHKGDLIMPQEQLDVLVEKYHRAGMQIAVHGNGDAAIESIIVAMERAQAKFPRDDARHMLIHAQTASLDHIRRMKRLGVLPSYFVNHVYYWGDRHLEIFLGPERAPRISPLASSLKEGVIFTLHSDLPVTAISPLDSIHNAVNRMTKNGRVLGPDERISALEAVKAYTTYAAKASFEEDIKGSITEGKLADFVVLSDNPMEVAPEEIRNIKVLRTVVGGATCYQAAE